MKKLFWLAPVVVAALAVGVFGGKVSAATDTITNGNYGDHWDTSPIEQSDTRATGHWEFMTSGLHIWTDGATSTDKVAEYSAITPVPLASVATSGIAITQTPTDPSKSCPDYSVSSSIYYGCAGLQLLVEVNGQTGIVVYEPWAYGTGNIWSKNSDFGAAQPQWDYAFGGTVQDLLNVDANAQIVGIGFSLGSGVKGDVTISQIVAGDAVVNFQSSTPLATTSGEPTVKNAACKTSDGAFSVVVARPVDSLFSQDVTYYAVLIDAHNNKILTTKPLTLAPGETATLNAKNLPVGDYQYEVMSQHDILARLGSVIEATKAPEVNDTTIPFTIKAGLCPTEPTKPNKPASDTTNTTAPVAKTANTTKPVLASPTTGEQPLAAKPQMVAAAPKIDTPAVAVTRDVSLSDAVIMISLVATALFLAICSGLMIRRNYEQE